MVNKTYCKSYQFNTNNEYCCDEIAGGLEQPVENGSIEITGSKWTRQDKNKSMKIWWF